MKLDSIVFYKINSRSWVSPWTAHADITTGNGVQTTASLFYAKKLNVENVYGQFGLGRQYTHELYIMTPGIFLKFNDNEVDDVISALAKAGYILEDG